MAATAATASSIIASTALDNSSTIKGIANALHSAPIIGSVMGPLVMVAILLEMAQLNEILKEFLIKIDVVLKQMLYTIQFITDVAITFNGKVDMPLQPTEVNNDTSTTGGTIPNAENGLITINQSALNGITEELVKFTEIISLYYDPYDVKKTDNINNNNNNNSTGRLSKAYSSVKSLGSRAFNYVNTFSSVTRNTDKAMKHIVVANMYFNSIFSQLEFQLRMIELKNAQLYKEKMALLYDKPSYKAIVGSGKQIVEYNENLTYLIDNMKDSLLSKAKVLSQEAQFDNLKNKSKSESQDQGQGEINGGFVKNIDDLSKKWNKQLTTFFMKIKPKNKTRRPRRSNYKKHKNHNSRKTSITLKKRS